MTVFNVEASEHVAICKANVEEISLLNIAKVRREFATMKLGNRKLVILDLQEVGFVDSSALGWMISVYKELDQEKKRFCLVSENDLLKEILKLTYIDKLIRLHSSCEEAMRQHLPAENHFRK